MELGELGNAVGELSHLLSQAIVLPFRHKGHAARAAARTVPRAGGVPRHFSVRMRGSLFLASGSLPDELVLDLIHRAGGRRAQAVILPVAQYSFAASGERYQRYLRRFGMDGAQTLDVTTRRQAEDAAQAGRLAAAELVLIGGGHPDLLLDVLGGTAAEAALAAALVRGAVVAVLGPAVEAVGQWCLPPPAPAGGGAAGLRRGLGLVPGTLIAASPHAGGRVASVFGAALTTGIQALVLDDGAVLAIRPGWQGEVRAGTVLAVGGGGAPAAGEAGRAPGPASAMGAPLGGVYTRVAPVGWRLDLAAHVVLPPGALLGAERP